MAFSLTEVYELEPNLCHAVVRHRDQLLNAMLRCSYAEAIKLPPEFVAEMDYTSMVRFEANLTPDNSQSGLFVTDDPCVILADGQVHNYLEIDSDYVLIDVYIQNGPEFFTVTSEELGGIVPDVGSRLRVWLLGLSIYPSNT
ncbi:MAG: hypothetical protein V4727_14280 [Verrucomicrobiota bacterium]